MAKTKEQVGEVKQIGVVSVDAGLCWIGDPCYILHKEKLPKALGNDWGGFCRMLRADKQSPTAKQFDHDSGQPGLGVVVETGYGDGLYPVYAEFTKQGRIAFIFVPCIESGE
jgi:hypothetical protein